MYQLRVTWQTMCQWIRALKGDNELVNTDKSKGNLSFKHKFDKHKARVPFLCRWELFRALQQEYGVG